MQRARRAVGNRAGLSLLELMFALTIMAVGVLAAFSSQVGSVDLLRSSRENDSAMTQLRAAMEDVLSVPPANLPTTYINGSVLAKPEFNYNPLGLSNFQIRVEYPGVALPFVPDPLEVRLIATWDDFQGRDREGRLSTVVVR